MGFDNHIFISYAHVDNMELGGSEWVTEFDRDLQRVLHQLWGKRPSIWRDPKLQGNDYFADEIVEQFPTVALLVSVVSPRYVQSEWCLKELKAFCEAAEQNGGIRRGNKGRIFKVIKMPIDLEQQPKEIQGFLGYEFFDLDVQGKLNPFSRIFGEKAAILYFNRLLDLAQDIKQLLEDLIDSADPLPAPPTKNISIYLAQSSYDLREEWDNVRRELKQRGYKVLPDQPLPSYYPDLEKQVKESLQQCKLSIHLIGKSYGTIPEEADRSLIQLQYELAVQHQQANSQFVALSWMPSELQIEEPRQLEFLELMQNDPEFSRTGLEDFKTRIQDRLNPPPHSQTQPQSESEFKRVYLIYDRADADHTLQIEDYIYEQGLEVIPSLLDGDETELREYHCDQLRSCDAVVIYYSSKTNWNWLQMKLNDLRKVLGYGRSQPLLHKAVFVAESCSETNRRRLRTREAEVIDSFDGFNAFITKVR